MELYLAPLQGLTEAPYRKYYAKYFNHIDRYYAPFITATESTKTNPILFQDVFPEHNDVNKVVPQLLGNNGQDFKFFASTIKAMGYEEINWNIGCPFPNVARKKRGSGLLPYPEMIEALLASISGQLDYKLSVKMRLGLEYVEEGLKVIDILNKYPISQVTIHARTGKQMYEGHVDLDAFERLYKACHHKLIYNGDINCLDDYKTIISRFPKLDGIMIGRGALTDPFLPGEIKNHFLSDTEKVAQMKKYHDAIYDYYKDYPSKDIWKRERNICNKMKEFWTYASPNLDSDGRFINKIRQTTCLVDYEELMTSIFSPSNQWHKKSRP